MGCLTFIKQRLFGDVKLTASAQTSLKVSAECKPSLKVSALTHTTLKVRALWEPALKVRCAIVCPTNLGYEYLWSSEHLLISFDGDRFILKKSN